MSSDVQSHSEPNYIAVFWSLLALTLIEVGVFYMHIGRVYFVTALVLLALIKAFLVAWFFMHLRSERWTLIFMTVIPLVLAVDLLLGLMPDIGHFPF
jgi:cytochrome c oxidase subunit 4